MRRSVSWVSQVERGEIVVGDVGMIQRLAVSLSAPSRELIELVLGEEAGDRERQRPYVEVLRLALAGHPAPGAALGLATRTIRAVSMDRVDEQVRHAWELAHSSSFEKLGPLLASLIPELELASRQADETDRDRLLGALANVYQTAAAMLVKVGDVGAGWIAADRAISAGERCGDRCLVMAGQWRMGHTFVDSQQDDLAVHVLRQAVQVAKTMPADAEAGLVSLTGACALLLAVLEARRGNADQAHHHLRAATGLGRRLGVDRDDYGTEFGPTNVTLHQVAVEVELSNAAEALRLANKVDASNLSSRAPGPFSRRRSPGARAASRDRPIGSGADRGGEHRPGRGGRLSASPGTARRLGAPGQGPPGPRPTRLAPSRLPQIAAT